MFLPIKCWRRDLFLCFFCFFLQFIVSLPQVTTRVITSRGLSELQATGFLKVVDKNFRFSR